MEHVVDCVTVIERDRAHSWKRSLGVAKSKQAKKPLELYLVVFCYFSDVSFALFHR